MKQLEISSTMVNYRLMKIKLSERMIKNLELQLTQKILEVLVLITARYDIALSSVHQHLIRALGEKQPEIKDLVSFKFLLQPPTKRAIGSGQALATLGYFHNRLQNDLIPPLKFLAYESLYTNRLNTSPSIPRDFQKKMMSYISVIETKKNKSINDFITLTVEGLIKILCRNKINQSNLNFIVDCLARGSSLSSVDIFDNTCNVINAIASKKINTFIEKTFVYSCRARNFQLAVEIIKQKPNDPKLNFNATDADLNTAVHHLVSRSILLDGDDLGLLQFILNSTDDLDDIKPRLNGNELKFVEENWVYLQLLKWLLDRKLPQLRNNFGLTPFLCAVREGDLPIVEKLGGKGVNYCVYSETNSSITQESGIARFQTAIDLVNQRSHNDPQKKLIHHFLMRRTDTKKATTQWHNASKYLFLIPVGLVTTGFIIYQHYANFYARAQEGVTALKKNPLLHDEIMRHYDTVMKQTMARASAPVVNDAIKRAKERLSPEHQKLLNDVRQAETDLAQLDLRSIHILMLCLSGAIICLIIVLLIRTYMNNNQKQECVLGDDRADNSDALPKSSFK